MAALRISPRSTLCVAGFLAAVLCLGRAGAQQPAADWRVEFEAVCVKTDMALTLSSEELADLVARCDRLAERIGTEGETVKKVYLKRLQSCRGLFLYVLESRRAASAGSSAPAPAPGDAQQPGEDASAPQGSPPAPSAGTPSP